jgi:ribosomal protein L37AE/L43A
MHDAASGMWSCSLCGTVSGGSSEKFRKGLEEVSSIMDAVGNVQLNHTYGKLDDHKKS